MKEIIKLKTMTIMQIQKQREVLKSIDIRSAERS